YWLPPPHPARRRGCQDAFPDPPTHAASCLWVQARQRRPRHTGSAVLPRPPEHPAYGPVHRNGAGPLQEFLALTGDGKLGTASPSITLAFAAASRFAIISSINSSDRSSCSSVIALTPPECSNFISRGTSIAQTFK